MGQFRKKGGQDIFGVLEVVGGFGLFMAACVLLGYHVGHFLVLHFGTYPWLMILCLLLSVVFGFIESFKIMKEPFFSETPRKRG